VAAEAMSPDEALPRAASERSAAITPAPALEEPEFRAFYESTAPRLRAYLRRVAAGDASLADDLLQEAYCRLLRAPRGQALESQRVAFLFKVATNLLHDHWRRSRREARWRERRPADSPAPEEATLAHDLSRVFAALAPRERALLWLAYVEGWTHEEMAGMLGVRTRSVRVLLFRARQNLAGRLRRPGLGPGRSS
jgi:RNA polymerase sigma-70 factor (ECF subfamily)